MLGKRVIKYMPSPKMSTYLLAFVVGEFDFVQVRGPSLLYSVLTS
jgi:aminopeptidase N